MSLMKVYITPEQIEAALKSLGRVGFEDESYVWTAAQVAIHVMRGGKLETVEQREKMKSCKHINIDTNYHCLNCNKFMDV